MANALTIHNDLGTVNTSILDGNQADPFKGLPSPNSGFSFPTSTLIKLSARKVSFQIATLGQTTHVYTSPSYDDIVALADYFADWSCNYEIQEGPIHTFTVTCPWDTMTSEDFFISMYASEQWELVPTSDTKDLLVNGLLSDSFTLPTATNGNYVILPVTVQLAVQRALENKTGINFSGSQFTPFQNYAQQVLDYKRRGVEGVPSYGQTLKRTAVIDKNNHNNAFNTLADEVQGGITKQGTANFIYSSDDLKLKYSIPANTVGKFMLPSYAKDLSVAGADPFMTRVYAGWLVKPPSLQFISRNKVQLTQEFVWNEWLDGLYYINSPETHFPLWVVPAATPA